MSEVAVMGNKDGNIINIHPFSIPASLQFSGHRGLLELIPFVRRRKAGSTLSRLPAYYRANTQRQIFNVTHTYGQFKLINSPDKHVFGSCKETRLPGENPHMHRETMQTPYRKARAEIGTPNLLAVRQQY